MDTDSVFETLEKTEEEITQAIQGQHSDQIHLIRRGISLILNGLGLAGDIIIDPKQVEQFILRRYLSVIPFRANWILRALTKGYPSTGFSLLRVLFEELISMNYFIQNPHAARSALNDEGYIEPGLSKKLNNITEVKGYHEIAKRLSEGYIHPLINKGPFTDTETGALPEPFYNTIGCNLGLDLLMFLVDRSAAHMEMFGLDKHKFHDFHSNLSLYLDDVKYYQANNSSILSKSSNH